MSSYIFVNKWAVFSMNGETIRKPLLGQTSLALRMGGDLNSFGIGRFTKPKGADR
jgi:hypothetical protein